MHFRVHYGTLAVARWVTLSLMLGDKELYPTAYPAIQRKEGNGEGKDNRLEIQVLSGRSSRWSRRDAQHVNAMVLLSSVQ